MIVSPENFQTENLDIIVIRQQPMIHTLVQCI
jgi:hypothetical protein